MSTIIKIIVTGNYVAEVKRNGKVVEAVGPGWPTKTNFDLPGDGESVTYEVCERPATESEVEEAKARLGIESAERRRPQRDKVIGSPARRARRAGQK